MQDSSSGVLIPVWGKSHKSKYVREGRTKRVEERPRSRLRGKLKDTKLWVAHDKLPILSCESANYRGEKAKEILRAKQFEAWMLECKKASRKLHRRLPAKPQLKGEMGMPRVQLRRNILHDLSLLPSQELEFESTETGLEGKPLNHLEDSLIRYLDHRNSTQEAGFQLHAISYILNMCLCSHTIKLIEKHGCLRIVLALAKKGEICKIHDPLFRWPRAAIRRAAVVALCQLLTRNTGVSNFYRRFLIREGIICGLADACTTETRCSLIFQNRYRVIDEGTKYLSLDAIQNSTSTGELVRSMSHCKSTKARECIKREIDRRTDILKEIRHHKDNAGFCKKIRLDSSIWLEPRLRAACLEVQESICVSKHTRSTKKEAAEEARRHYIRKISRLSQSLGVADITSTVVQFSEESLPDPNKDPCMDSDDEVDNESYYSESDDEDEEEVVATIEALIVGTEARCFTEEILNNLVETSVQTVEQKRQELYSKELERKSMIVEDSYALALRNREESLRKDEVVLMINEDKKAVRARVRKLPKAEKRAYMLREAEYERRVGARHQKALAKRYEREWTAMEEEDRLARRIRKRDRFEESQTRWREATDEQGNMYYVNNITQEWQYEPPDELRCKLNESKLLESTSIHSRSHASGSYHEGSSHYSNSVVESQGHSLNGSTQSTHSDANNYANTWGEDKQKHNGEVHHDVETWDEQAQHHEAQHYESHEDVGAWDQTQHQDNQDWENAEYDHWGGNTHEDQYDTAAYNEQSAYHQQHAQPEYAEEYNVWNDTQDYEWAEYYDDNGYLYYYNNTTGVSQYEDPYTYN